MGSTENTLILIMNISLISRPPKTLKLTNIWLERE